MYCKVNHYLKMLIPIILKVIVTANTPNTKPMQRSIATAFLRKLTIIFDSANSNATSTYQAISITPATVAMTMRSYKLMSSLMNWLNIATKKTNIFGLKNEIKKPSIKPLLCGLSLSWLVLEVLLVNILYANQKSNIMPII